MPMTIPCIAVGAAAGAATIPAVGLAAKALVPVAMSNFGTVVSGVGTIHASYAAGGTAAGLQVISSSLIAGMPVVAAGLGGALLFAFFFV